MPKRPLLITELYVKALNASWQSKRRGDKAEVKIDEDLRLLSQQTPPREWEWQLRTHGVCEDGRTFQADFRMRHRKYRPAREPIVEDLAAQAARFEEEAKQAENGPELLEKAKALRVLAGDLRGEPLPEPRRILGGLGSSVLGPAKKSWKERLRPSRIPRKSSRIPLIANLSLYVHATDDEFEWSGPETEAKTTAFLQGVIHDNPQHRTLNVEIWGSTDEEQDFECIATIDSRRFIEVRVSIIQALAKRAAKLGTTKGHEDL